MKAGKIMAASVVAVAALMCAGLGFGAMEKPADAPSPSAAVEIVRDGEYNSKDEVAQYIRKFNGALPKNYITKAEARKLGWHGGPLEPYAPGKSIGGDRFGNYERQLPNGNYKECDIDTKGRSRGAKRIVFTTKGERIYYTPDHYNTFEEIKKGAKK